MGEWKLIGPLAYRGKVGCQSMMCTRMRCGECGKWACDHQPCFGYHCSYCDEPCGSQGHGCDAAEAVLGEARRQADG